LSRPRASPTEAAAGRLNHVVALVVELTTDAGLVGIGEAHGPFLFRQGPEGMRVVNEIMQQITPLVVGEDPFNSERIWQDLFALTYTSVRGIPALARQQRQLVTAMSAIDIALWDLKGKAIERPVYALLGGALRQKIPAYVTGFYYKDNERPDDLARRRRSTWRATTLKVKVGGLTPGRTPARCGYPRGRRR
jgi:L-alanine-DL-glutamate epimerase-like enolase superfamily enzyme